jgi:DNA gyrase/topoisomerase IV subunit B
MAAKHSEELIGEGFALVRSCPEYFIRDIRDKSTIHDLLFGLLGVAIDEHLRGFVRRIRIAIDGDTATIEDDGRGIPIDAFTFVLTQLSHRAHEVMPHLPPALIDMIIPVTNALSSAFEVTVWRDGHEHVRAFRRGEPAPPVQTRCATTRTGTRFVFTPDFTFLARHSWDLIAISQRCRAFAGLLRGLVIELNGDTYRYDSIVDCVRDLAACDVIEPFTVDTHENGIGIELALAWGTHAVMQAFVDHERVDAGVHVDALRAAIRAVLERRNVATDRLEQHVVAVLHVSVGDDRFRYTPTNPTVGEAVRNVVERELERHLEAVPALLDRILIDLE